MEDTPPESINKIDKLVKKVVENRIVIIKFEYLFRCNICMVKNNFYLCIRNRERLLSKTNKMVW